MSEEEELSQSDISKNLNSISLSDPSYFLGDFELLGSSQILIEPPSITLSGVFFGTLSMLFMLSGYVLSQHIIQTTKISPYEIIFLRSLISIPFGLIYLKYHKTYLFNLQTTDTSRIFFSSFLAFLSLCGLYTALNYLYLTEALILLCFENILSLLLQWVFFSAVFQLAHVFGLVTTLVAIIFLSDSHLERRAEMHEEYIEERDWLIGLVGGLLGALCRSVSYAINRKHLTRVTLISCDIFESFMAAILAPLIALIHFNLRGNASQYTFHTLLLMIIVGALNWFGVYLLYRGLFKEKVLTRLTVYNYIALLLSPIFDIFLFQRQLGWGVLIAVTLSAGINIYIAIMQMKSN